MEPNPPSIASLGVHDRIRTLDGRHGRIAYIGALPGRPASQTFLGIEFDLPNQGKHDGTFQNVRLFGPTKHVAAGSLLPMDSVIVSRCAADSPSPSASISSNFHIFVGITLEEALMRRYGQTVENLELHPISFGTKQVEMVLSQHDLSSSSKSIFSVPGECVVSCAVSGLPRSWTDSILHLDLSDNMIWDWSHASQCLSVTFKSLSILNLSQNPLRAPHGEVSVLQQLKTLVLNRCIDLDWNIVASMMASAPYVEELHLSGNALKNPSNSESLLSAFSSLVEISLSENVFKSWAEIEWLGYLPCLKRLVLSSCGMERIRCRRSGDVFPTLAHVSLSDNPIASWIDVAELNYIPNMVDLRLQRCDFLKDSPQQLARLLIVAIVPKLHSLNGSTISLKERGDAERTLLSRLKTLPAELGASLSFLADLRQKHPDISDSDQLGAQIHNSAIDASIEVELRSPYGGTAIMTLPLNLTLPKLIALFKRTFSEMDSSFQMFWRAHSSDALERIPLEQLSLTLGEIIPSWATYTTSANFCIEARI
jgi:hypothetical protein